MDLNEVQIKMYILGGYFPLLIFLLFGLSLLLFPLFGQWRLMLFVGICCFFAATLTYMQVGSWRELEKYKHELIKQKQVRTVLREFQGIEGLIDKLKQKVAAEPSKDKGWYLLGRLYLTQSQWHPARLAFGKAQQLNPAMIKYRINYGLALFNENHRLYTKQVIDIFNKVLKEVPTQPDALMILGQAACEKKHYQKGLKLLRQLLALLPQDSEEATLVRQRILSCKP